MKNIKKMGAVAAFYMAAVYVIGFLVFILAFDYMNIVDPIQKVALIVKQHNLMIALNILMYIVFGYALIVFVLALYDHLKSKAPNAMLFAAIIGILWAGLLIASGMVANSGILSTLSLLQTNPAEAATYWMGIETVANGLGGANGEICGGLMTLMISMVALRGKVFAKYLNLLGIFIGIVGIVSVVPILNDLSGVFGMAQILWYIGIGLSLWRVSRLETAPSTQTNKQ